MKIENITTEELMTELNKRKKKEVEEIVNTVNDCIKKLDLFGVYIIDGEDSDIQLTEVKDTGVEIEFHTKWR